MLEGTNWSLSIGHTAAHSLQRNVISFTPHLFVITAFTSILTILHLGAT